MRYERSDSRSFKIFFQESEHDPVDPLAVAQIRLPFHSLPHETGALRMANGTLVEAVALELQPVKPEVEEQVVCSCRAASSASR